MNWMNSLYGEEIRVNNIVYEISSLRRQLKYYYGPSCMVLSGFGPNSAPLRPKITDEIITENNTYLFDSGGQFLDGTTDIGRTYHFGSPNDKEKWTGIEKEIYTRLLMTHINLASKVWWDVRTGRELDTDGIRKPLHDIGLDFPHESGHMISAFGVIVEGPASISSSKSDWKSDVNIDTDIFNFSNVSVSEELLRYPDYRDYPLAEGMCFSNEPSYYGNGDFGMRIENTMVIKKVIVKESSSDHLFEFEQFTMVPFEQKLIKRELLTDKQVNWVNNYHNRVRETLRPILEAKGDRLGLKWMNKKTQYIH